MPMEELIDTKEIIVCCGSGGVGKTTTAAAIAIHAAMMGKKVIVLTIDPAKRLANSLGLSELGNQERRVPPQKFAEIGLKPKGELYAMMLDTKRTFDELIIKYSLNADMRDRLLNNALYRNISNAFAGSQEYMAMEKLFEIYSQGDYDLIVLDTPSTKHALDFLDAPRRMTDFLDGSILKWFLKPYFSAGKAGIRIFQRGSAVIMRTLEKVTGAAALKIVSDFFISFEGMYDGFKERAEAVLELLQYETTAFVLVTSPEEMIVEEALFFYDKLVEYEMPICALIVNKVHAGFVESDAAGLVVDNMNAEAVSDKLSKALARTADEQKTMRAVVKQMVRNLDNFQSLAKMDAMNIRRLEKHLDDGITIRDVPFLDTDVHDLDGLMRINEAVFKAG